MNPYAAATFGKQKTTRELVKAHQDLFAADVYREEPVDRKNAEEAVGEEIARLRTELRGEARALRSRMAKPRVPTELLAEISALRAAVDEIVVAPKRGDALSSAIRARGIEGACAAVLARVAKGKETGGARGAGAVHARLRAAISAMVTTTPLPATLRGKDRGIIALVGPAGVGKTTTAAKLAARARMARRSVAFVSCDSFRVGAVDQLSAYAELLDARMHVATTQQELLDVLVNEDADVIIVDTSGRAVEPDATEAVLCFPEVRASARLRRQVDVLLCVPASLRASDATRVLRDFAAVEPTALAITKLDETDTPAGIVHAAFATRLPVSVLCAGQRVPEDMAAASDEDIAARVISANAEVHEDAETSGT